MVHLVLIGLGARSTLFYQEKLHDLFFDNTENYPTCPFLLKQLNFNQINPSLPDGIEKISPILSHELQSYDRENVAILVPNITIHKVLDTFSFRCNIVHPYVLLREKLKDNQIDKIIIFGTKHTPKDAYVKTQLPHLNIEVLQEEEMLFLDNLRKRVYAYQETENDIILYNTLLQKYAKNHTVVIACTELSVINSSSHKNIIDLALLQCQAAINLKPI